MRWSILTVLLFSFFSVSAQKQVERPAWNVTLGADKSAGSSITVQNRCKRSHTFEILTRNASFLEIGENEIKVGGGKNKIVPVRFNTNGVKPGAYNGEVLVICTTCGKEPTCTQDRETLPIVLKVPGIAAGAAGKEENKTAKEGSKSETVADKKEPYSGYNFEIVIDGLGDGDKKSGGSFTELSGLDLEPDPIEYRGGSEDITPRKIPGMKKFTNITLKRGVITDLAFWNWILEGVKGKADRKRGSIVLLNENRKEVMRWNFSRGWPCKWTGPGLNDANNEVALETLEICNEGLEK